MRINEMITSGKVLDSLLPNSPNQLFKEKYGDHSGEVVCGCWDSHVNG